ncbi:dihydrofolate reductase [Herbiconiux sp.]|uniref:dihydrofolate reductase n=1 Tax=Herbiconiux sp. TaxID=1871186 RepID=UPI0025C564DE|nr:dihydrofolate reductase [Herbiconiux sp.]
MSVALIWAEARGGVIGQGGGIPWHLPEDLAHFRELTCGSTVVMGRKTWDSLPERFRPLPGRRNIVVTRDAEWTAEGAQVAHSLEAALGTGADETVWVIGGGDIYRQALGTADRIEITEVDLDPVGDTRAPEVGEGWARSQDPVDGFHESKSGIQYRFVTLTRDEPAAGQR